MTILEMTLLFLVILVGGSSVLFINAIWRSSVRKSRDADQKFRDAEQKYRQEREARDSAEGALRRAESERHEAEHKLQQAHDELQAAEDIRRQAQDEVRAANTARAAALEQARLASERAQRAEELQKQAESARDVAIRERDEAIWAKEQSERACDEAIHARDEALQAKEQAEHARDAAIARTQLAEQAKTQAENERDVAQRERDQAIQARQSSEENARQAVQAKFDADEGAHLANERAQHAEELQKQVEQDRDEALEQVRSANERVQRAEELQKHAERDREAAIRERNEAIRAKQVAEEEARRANERAQRAEELQNQAEDARDAVIRERDDALRAKDQAERERSAAIERAERAEKEPEDRKATTARAIESSTSLSAPSSSSEGLEKPESRSQVVKPSVPIEKRRGVRSTEPQFHKALQPRSPQPEIVCVQKQGEWILGVELPQDWLDARSDLQVLQNGSPLNGEDGHWQLNDAHGNLVVRSNEEIVWQIELGKRDEPLVFRLSGDLEQGRCVRAITCGWYLLIVPDDWKHEDYAPQSVPISGYHAFCRLVDDRHDLVFQSASHQNIPPLIPRATQFAMMGNRLADADEKFGPLFGNTLPVIHADNPNIWHHVRAIIVGEEGRKREEWNSVVFAPDARKADQELPPEIAEKIVQWSASWFFLRFYDENDQLIESLDLRLARGLQKIQVNPASALPTGSGHSTATIEFHHTPDCHIEPLSKVEIETDGGMTLAEIPSRVEFDRTDWRIIAQGHDAVQVAILVERIWWAIGTEDKPPPDSEWIAQPLALNRTDFAAVSDKVLWIHLPHPRWADEVRVGFAQETPRSFRVEVTKQTVPIPLCNFCDSASLEQVGWARFVIQGGNSVTTLAEVRVQAKCRYCDFVADSVAEILSHVEQYHLNVLFQPLTYEEHRQRNPSLPHRIAICCKPGCNYYAGSYSPLENVTSLIMEHIRQKKHYDEEGHPHFEELADVRKIRDRLPELIPDIRRCTISPCDWEKENPFQNDLLQHLREKHLHALYELC